MKWRFWKKSTTEESFKEIEKNMDHLFAILRYNGPRTRKMRQYNMTLNDLMEPIGKAPIKDLNTEYAIKVYELYIDLFKRLQTEWLIASVGIKPNPFDREITKLNILIWTIRDKINAIQ